ncbi:hypothetical protein GUITHDRAFT_149405 [Guillardia theta CCMP2712]|uniref:Uncharacterized protein n=1 Tax=Guillardia theta (strain CCMP2712) TaxID=905079 RepID=L1I5D6_GUITC|nr:hypothetical protein GUITHDRAFT_149405 [Guillardia theta CCMP2712]EKX31272.1 hypothetical protein GUITHDRAFT_149405 [Guillardia theta CCMP2712]|eukprot:XP_005818252.1 hypothetical protein GUITHDRAFT_149405 [Guillardia theta CCMP2712]
MSPIRDRSFTEFELRRLREMQEITYGNFSISRHRTVGPSFMSSKNWNHSKMQDVTCPDFTTMLDKPTGTTNIADRTYRRPDQGQWKHQHSSGVYNMERSKAVYAAVRQRYEECHDKRKVAWYEGEERVGCHRPEGGAEQPICRDERGEFATDV